MTAGPTLPVSPWRGGVVEKRFLEHWSFASMAILMIATSIAGFAPAILDPAGRRGPVSTLAAIHGIVFFGWLLLFLIQSLLAGPGWSHGTAGWVLRLSVYCHWL